MVPSPAARGVVVGGDCSCGGRMEALEGCRGLETSQGGTEPAEGSQLPSSGGLTPEPETTKIAQLSKYGLRGGSEGWGSESDRTGP